MTPEPEDIVEFIMKWCYINLSELVLVKHEDLFRYPATNDLQQDFVNRFLDTKAFDEMIAKSKKYSDKKMIEINAFVGHCLRIVRQQGTSAMSNNGVTVIIDGEEIVVSLDELLPDCIEIRMGQFHIPVRRCDSFVNKLMDDLEEEPHEAMTPFEAHQAKLDEALGALMVNLRPFQPRK